MAAPQNWLLALACCPPLLSEPVPASRLGRSCLCTWEALFLLRHTQLIMDCRGCWVGECLCPFFPCSDLDLFAFAHWGRLSKQQLPGPRPQPRSSPRSHRKAALSPNMMRLLFPALVLALLVAAHAAEGEPAPNHVPSPCRVGMECLWLLGCWRGWEDWIV